MKGGKRLKGGAKFLGVEWDPRNWGKKSDDAAASSETSTAEPTVSKPDVTEFDVAETVPVEQDSESLPISDVDCDKCKKNCRIGAADAAAAAGNELTQQVTDALQGGVDAVNSTGKDLQNQLSTGFLGVLAPFKWLFYNFRGIRKPTPREPMGRWGMTVWSHKSTALACAHFMLAMRAHGFDSCPMEGLDSKRVKRLLGLPRQAGITMAISAGKRAEGGVFGDRFRFDKKHFVIKH